MPLLEWLTFDYQRINEKKNENENSLSEPGNECSKCNCTKMYQNTTARQLHSISVTFFKKTRVERDWYTRVTAGTASIWLCAFDVADVDVVVDCNVPTIWNNATYTQRDKSLLSNSKEKEGKKSVTLQRFEFTCKQPQCQHRPFKSIEMIL